MALVLTLKQGQGFWLDDVLFTVEYIYSGQSFTITSPGLPEVNVSSDSWSALIPRRAWVQAAFRKLGGKEVGVMVDAPGFRVEREGETS